MERVRTTRVQWLGFAALLVGSTAALIGVWLVVIEVVTRCGCTTG